VTSRLLIDTNAYTAFKRDDARIVGLLRRAEKIGMSPVVAAELLAGFCGGDREPENRDQFLAFVSSPRVLMLTIDRDTAEHYAAVYTHLRRKGRPIPTNDMWVAASALQFGMALLSQDSHFAEIDGLLLA
jgi:tRNA(fMet)-specific endonuclease VapC